MYGIYDEDYFVERVARPKKARASQKVQTREKYEALAELRTQYGFISSMSVRAWSKGKIAEVLAKLPEEKDGGPRNAPIYSLLQEKFSWRGSRWEFREGKVVSTNLPTVDGHTVSLFDLFITPLELVDGYQRVGTSG